MTLVAVGVQVTEMGPGSRRCPSGFWRAACRCVFWVQGVTWWCWTGCDHLLHKGERHWWLKKGGQMAEIRRQMNWKDCFPETLTVVYDSVCCTVCVRIVIIWRKRKRLSDAESCCFFSKPFSNSHHSSAPRRRVWAENWYYKATISIDHGWDPSERHSRHTHLCKCVCCSRRSQSNYEQTSLVRRVLSQQK